MGRRVVPAFETPHRLAMGLEALDPDDPWLELDEDLDSDLAEKQRLVATHREQVWVALPESLAAQREALDVVCAQLAALGVRERPAADAAEPPLLRAARMVQEDLCVLEPGPSGYALTAAAVCFPTRWDLPSRLGLSMTAIHERVPGYREELAVSADRFFDRIKPGRVFRRKNWSLVDDPALFQPGGKLRTARNPHVTAQNAGDRIWIRVEHQTLQRFPRTGAVLFTIRVYRTSLRALAETPGAAQALARSLASMSKAFLLYKSFPPIRDAVTAYLERIA